MLLKNVNLNELKTTSFYYFKVVTIELYSKNNKKRIKFFYLMDKKITEKARIRAVFFFFAY